MTDAAFKLDESTHDAANAPRALLEASTGRPNDVQRDTGLILTKEQIKNLKAYELAGLALPTQLSDVIAYLGYSTGAGVGLEASDFQKTFQLIHKHASLWNPLRTALLSEGSQLQVFAGQILVHGETILEICDDIKAIGIVEQYNIKNLGDVRRLELELGDRFPGIEMLPADKETQSELSYYIDRILIGVKEREQKALEIKTQLDEFGFALANSISPAIKQKLATIDNNSLGQEIKQLQTKIDARSKVIDEKTKEYQEAVKQAIGSVTAGLIMVIYTSVMAEKIRKERNDLRKEQDRDINLMNTKDRILASLGRVRLELQDLDLVVIDADIATKNLITVWNKLTIFISASSEAVDGVNDALSLRRFKHQFKLVLKPWETIETDADLLLNVFKQADEEFRKEYGDQ